MWSNLVTTKPPYIPENETKLKQNPDAYCLTLKSFDAYIKSKDFGNKDRWLHTGLLPMPYIGYLKKASIFILTLNPGLKPLDYYSEYQGT